ncbi:MAG: GWxTD domain-containing protein [Cyclobacteriaceae bacterium]|jgi:GWxTD domain-containing protein
MKNVLTGIVWIMAFSANGQAVTSLNFSHWYNPKNEVDLKLHLARGDKKLVIHYQLKTLNALASAYTISWESRASFNHRDGELFLNKDSVQINEANVRSGILTFELPAKPWILLAKVTHIESQRSWYYYKLMEAIYPVRGWIENGGSVLHENYLTKDKSYAAKNADGKPFFVSYYKTTFGQPYPPFSEQKPAAERFLFHDSLFQLPSGATFTPRKHGLYLFQQDTTAEDGFSMRIVNDTYPKLNNIEDLAGPLIFITTPDEYKQLLKVNGDKPVFDKIVLDITRDKDRARNFMRSYFQRVEQANRYFGSFKEGWKTDRGMIYTIFGVPDELGKNQGNEVWSYKSYNVRFTFVKSGSVYDAENFILLRDKRFSESWYSTVDLWRKSRF